MTSSVAKALFHTGIGHGVHVRIGISAVLPLYMPSIFPIIHGSRTPLYDTKTAHGGHDTVPAAIYHIYPRNHAHTPTRPVSFAAIFRRTTVKNVTVNIKSNINSTIDMRNPPVFLWLYNFVCP